MKHTRGLEGQPPVQYEHEVVTGDGEVSRGRHWTQGDFSVTTNQPISEVLIIGSNTGAWRKGRVEVAKVRFTVQKNRPVGKDKTFVSGMIVVTEGGAGNTVQGQKRRAVVSGNGEMWALRRRGRQLLAAEGRADRVFSAAARRARTRRGLSATLELFPKTLRTPANAVRGDLNLDGDFTVSDLTFLKGFIQGTQSLSSSYGDYQKREMDPRFMGYSFTGKSLPDVGDVGFILNTLAKKKRFLVAPPSIAVEDCVMTVSALFVDDKSNPVTSTSDKMLLELRGSANRRTAQIGRAHV